MNLDEFITQALQHKIRNSYVEEPGFDSLYVRLATRYIEDKRVRTLDLASVAVSKTGQGTFTNLVNRLREQYPTLIIFVESVLTPRFAAKLIKMGFVERKWEPNNFYLLPKQE